MISLRLLTPPGLDGSKKKLRKMREENDRRMRMAILRKRIGIHAQYRKR